MVWFFTERAVLEPEYIGGCVMIVDLVLIEKLFNRNFRAIEFGLINKINAFIKQERRKYCSL